MSQNLIDEILGDASSEHSRRRGEVVDFPLVSKHLKATAPKEPEIREGAVRVPFRFMLWLPRVGKYLGFACLLAVALNTATCVRREAIYADIGRTTCSPANSIMWLEESPGSHVPQLREEVLARCAEAMRLD